MEQNDGKKNPIPEVKVVGDLEANAITKFDEWFRYAETIGQQRLGSYLFTASITLAAFATLYSREVFLLSLIVSLFGMAFSFMWAVIGTRQGKFHEKMESEIDHWLEVWRDKNEQSVNKKDIEQFPIWHVRNMKRGLDKQKISKLEQIFMTRRFLWLVPSLLFIVYILCSLFAIRRIVIT